MARQMIKLFKHIAFGTLLFVFVGCGEHRDYWNALPEQSAAVASIDLPRLANRAGLSGEGSEAQLSKLKDLLKSDLATAGPLIDRLFADASECGIDFKDKLYLFSSDENAILGFLAKVSSSDKLEDVVMIFSKEQLCQPVHETDGCKWTVLGKWLLAYSDDALLVLADNKWSDSSKLVRQASMWLRQGEGQGFAAKSDFTQLQSAETDVSLWTSLQMLPRKVLTPLTMGLSAELDLKKVKAITTVDFEPGKVVINVDPLFTDPVVSQLMEQKAQSMEPIKGSHLDLFPAKTPFWMSARLKGKQFYDFLRNIPAVRKFFDYSDLPITIDYGRIFEAINGDVSFTITDPRQGEFIFYADVNQTAFLSVFTELKPMFAQTNGMLDLAEQGTNAYRFFVRNGSVMNLHPGTKIFWMGVKDGRFYFTNNEALINQRVLGLSLRNKTWGKQVPGMNFFSVTDWNGLVVFEYFLQQQVLQNIPKSFPPLLDYTTIESPDGQHLRMVVHQKDKENNLIRLLFHL